MMAELILRGVENIFVLIEMGIEYNGVSEFG
jgi:hypothetical protein